MAKKTLKPSTIKKSGSSDALKDNLEDYSIDHDDIEDMEDIEDFEVVEYISEFNNCEDEDEEEETEEEDQEEVEEEIEEHEEEVIVKKTNKKAITKNNTKSQDVNKEMLNSTTGECRKDVDKEMFSSLIGEVQKMDSNSKEEGFFERRLQEKDSKKFLDNVRKFLNSDKFEKKCEELSVLHKVDKNKIAESFSQKIIATIADCMGTVVEVTYCATTFLINMLSCVLKAAVGLVCSIANRILGFLSLGYTRTLA